MKCIKNIIIIILLLVLLFATIFSISKFEVINPFSACFGMLQILYTDKEYTEVQKWPKRVIFCKGADGINKNPYDQLDGYMKNRGYELEEQLGSILRYSNGEKIESIYFSVNMYYSKWVWK